MAPSVWLLSGGVRDGGRGKDRGRDVIIWVYGQQKSASSFCFQLVCDVLQAAGFEQHKRRAAVLAMVDGSMLTGLRSTQASNVKQLVAALGEDKAPLAIKTHGNLTPRVHRMLDEGKAIGFATFRDPGDAALSLYEHGERNRLRDADSDRGFAQKQSLSEAIDHMARTLPRIAAWAAHPAVQPISFDTLCDTPELAVRVIATCLGVTVSERAIVEPYLKSQRRIGNFNVGEKGRFQMLASDEERQLASRLFGDFAPPADAVHALT